MATYGLKFRAVAQTIAGMEILVDIRQRGYTGAVIQRPFGETPRLRMEGDPVVATSLEFSLECQEEDEFVELYTSSALEYMVDYFYDGDNVFTGYITPELYASSWVDPPYDVRIVASDNLAELKGQDWTARGATSLKTMMEKLLEPTGVSLGIQWVSTLLVGNNTPQLTLASLLADFDHMDGKSFYDVLEALLTALHARLVQLQGLWVVFRETDLALSLTGDALKAASGTQVDTVMTFGSQKTSAVWPVGHLSMEISPAHSSQVLKFSPEWKTNSLRKSSSGGRSTYTFSVGQWVNKSPELELVLTASSTQDEGQDLDVVVRNPNGDYLTSAGEWSKDHASFKVQVPKGTDARDISIVFPGAEVYRTQSGYLGTFTVSFQESYTLLVSSVTLRVVSTWDLSITARLTNSARTPADEVELPVLDVSAGSDTDWVRNIWSTSGSSDVRMSTGAITARRDYRELIAYDYALSHANPRLMLKGTLSMFSAATTPSLLYRNRGILYLATMLNWDACNEELEVELVSLPASELSVVDVTVTKTTK